MKTKIVYFFVANFLLACQPYGTPTATPICTPPKTIDEILIEQEPFVIDVFNLFKKINTDRFNNYKKELLRISDLIQSLPVEKANIDTLKKISPLFQKNQSFTQDDYTLLLSVVIQLVQNVGTEDSLQKGIDLYIDSSFRRPNFCLSPEFF